MSTLKVTNIQSNGAGFNDVVSFQNSAGTENGTLCRAWVNFDGTFATSPFNIANGGIRASFNVSSIKDNGTGDYTITFTNPMVDGNYFASGSCQMNSVVSSLAVDLVGSGSMLTSSCRVRSSGGNSNTDNTFDSPVFTLAIFR